MRREVKQRKRLCLAAEKLQEERRRGEKQKTSALLYKSMARTYWDRWQWELQKRKEAMQELRTGGQRRQPESHGSLLPAVHQIDPSHLTDPVIEGNSKEVYVGRGSFSVVRLQTYRDIKVAVKEFLRHYLHTDAQNEARILSIICHTHLPYVFGICTTARPYRLVTQFHGIAHETVTLCKELKLRKKVNDGITWLILCSQLEAVKYLQCKVNILHNDIKGDNILLSRSDLDQFTDSDPTKASASESVVGGYHAVLTDFGKATQRTQGRCYNLSEPEKVEYLVKYRHIAPEVIHGETRQSTFSDIYAVGMVLVKMIDYHCFRALPNYTIVEIKQLVEACRSVIYHKTPTEKCLSKFKEWLS